MATSLQEGIYWDKGQRPGRFFTILFLRADRGAAAAEVRDLFATLWGVYQNLKRGMVSDLPSHPVPPGDLTVLAGFGLNVFQISGMTHPAPAALGPQAQFRSPIATGGGPLLRGGGLIYGRDIAQNNATEEICVQFIAESQLAVNRCIVETWKVLQAASRPDTGVAVLTIAGFFSGYQRDDGRSWLDFHDGVSNLQSGDDRRRVIAIKPETAGADGWTIGGTYLAFIRLSIDLVPWRALSVSQQEAVVGRAKLSGCPLISLNAGGSAVSGCPVGATAEVTDAGNEDFREPPANVTSDVELSHVQRANHHRGPLEHVDSRRIFRQGYEFFEPSDAAPGFRTGLNFVSFQDDPTRLTFILTEPQWLGNVNFGGAEGVVGPPLLSVRAAGIYYVPPLSDGERFPGADLFPEAAVQVPLSNADAGVTVARPSNRGARRGKRRGGRNI